MSSPTIAVHDGSFHADDVFAVAVLKILYPESSVIRTRDPDLLARANFRLDVGGKHDPLTGDFDHHQNESVGVRDNGIPYASAGLVWQYYGEKITGNAKSVELIDDRLIQLIDANDNGFSLEYDNSDPRPYSVSRVIESFNPVWDDKKPDFDRAFQAALDVASRILNNELRKVRGREKARRLVENALRESEGAPFIVLEANVPWQDIIVDQSEALYVLYPSPTGDWRVRGVPVRKGSFELRKSLPREWAGKRDQEFVELTGVSDALFCHKERFLAVARSRDGAEQLVMKALEY